jgi:hypothetical protein
VDPLGSISSLTKEPLSHCPRARRSLPSTREGSTCPRSTSPNPHASGRVLTGLNGPDEHVARIGCHRAGRARLLGPATRTGERVTLVLAIVAPWRWRSDSTCSGRCLTRGCAIGERSAAEDLAQVRVDGVTVTRTAPRQPACWSVRRQPARRGSDRHRRGLAQPNAGWRGFDAEDDRLLEGGPKRPLFLGPLALVEPSVAPQPSGAWARHHST